MRTFLGPFTRFHIQTVGNTTLTADIPSQQAREFFAAQNVVLTFPAEACQVLPLETGVIEAEKLPETV